MSTDHSSLPSMMDVRSRWEQLSNDNTPDPSSSSSQLDTSSTARPSFHRSTKSFHDSTNGQVPVPVPPADQTQTQIQAPTQKLTPKPPAPAPPSPCLNTNINKSSPNLPGHSPGSAAAAPPPVSATKLKPAVAPKPARLSSNLQGLSLQDKEQLANAPEITVSASNLLNAASSSPPKQPQQQHSSMMPPPPPPPRSTTPVPPPRSVTPVPPTSPNLHHQQKPAPPAPRSPNLYPVSSSAPTGQSPFHQRAASRVVSEGVEHLSNANSPDALVPPPVPTRRVVTPPETRSPAGYFDQRPDQQQRPNPPPPRSPKPAAAAAPPPPPPRRVPSSSSNPHLPLVSSTSPANDDLSPPSLPVRPSRSVSPGRRLSDESHSDQDSTTVYAARTATLASVASVASASTATSSIDTHLTAAAGDDYLSKNRSNTSVHTSGDDELYYEDHEATQQEYPDTSRANRREPIYEGVLHQISMKSEARALASFGRYVCVSGTTTRVFDLHSGECLWTMTHPDVRITAAAFKIMGNELDGKVLWLGTKEGQLWEVSIEQNAPVHKRPNCHLTPLVLIYQYGQEFWTLSDDGKLCIWGGDLTAVPKTFRVTPNFKAFAAVNGQLWIGRTRQANVYQPSLHENTQFSLTSRPIPAFTIANGRQAGEFSCAGKLPSMPDCVLFGHEDGTVTIYSISRMTAIESVNVCTSRICSLRGVGHYLWLGLKNGHIMVCDVNHKPWQVLKDWKAHDGPVSSIYCDDMSLKAGILPVLTASTDLFVNVWDGLLKRDWIGKFSFFFFIGCLTNLKLIEMDMFQHDEEYSTFRDIKAHVVTWNAGAAKPKDLERNKVDDGFLVNMLTSHGGIPDLIVFGFQELVELDNKGVTAKSMFSKRKRRDKDVSVAAHISHQYKAWQDRLMFAIGEAYQGERFRLVHSNNMVGLFTCVFLRDTMSSSLQGIRSSVVKTGLGGLHGNKGGLAVRMMLDNTSLCFVNCHLAAGQSSSLQRNKDISSILDTQLTDESVNTEFTGKGVFVNGGDGTRILDHEICFFSGDMNYRINTQRPIALKLLQDQDYAKLLEMDQLSIELKKSAGMRLRAFQEMAIQFPPTYKFDVGTDNYDTSEKKRVPAWCDRIFYRGGKRVAPINYSSHVVRVSDHRPVSGFYKIQIKTIDKNKRNETYKASLKRWNTFLNEAVDNANL